MRTTEIQIETEGRRVVDITPLVRRFVAEGNESGILNIFLPHATAGLGLMETGSGSEEDLEELMERLMPRDDRYVHRLGSRGHGGDHLLPVLAAPSLVLPVEDGELAIGTWQSVVVVDPNLENNRRRVKMLMLPG
ncbi:MAG: secondary thiamine-phosphate synthase enzyme YjbQ [Actinomycetota bacterium]